MNKKEAIIKLNEIAKLDDTEEAHYQADAVLCEFAPPKVVDAWRDIEKWYS